MDVVNVQQIISFCADAVWHMRFELMFIMLTAAGFFLSKLGSRMSGLSLEVPYTSLSKESKFEERCTAKQIDTAKPHTDDSNTTWLSGSPQRYRGAADREASSPRRSPTRRRPAGLEARARPQSPDPAARHHRALARQTARMILAESRRENGKPLEMYQDALAGGTCFAHLPEAEAHRVYLVLALAALRAEAADAVVPLLQDMRNQSIPAPPQLLSLIIKRCVQRRLFGKCLAAYDVAAKGVKKLCIDDHEFWSSMLLSAVETGEFAQSGAFWQAAKNSGEPTAQDFACVIRAAASQGAWSECLEFAEAAHREGHGVDCAVGNLAVSACVAAQQLGAGRRMMELMESDGRATCDAVTYNTIMKGYAFADDLDQALKLHASMRERGVRPTQVTFGILLDACVNRGDLEHAAEVFQDMMASGCPMNTVLYTTLIKGLARAGRVDKAMEVYRHMREQSTVKPDIILFSVLIKANCDAGRMESALRLFESMMELGHRPDEIVFNTLLAGCVRDSNLTLGRKLLEDMARIGIRPSHATASVLIKLYAKCHMLDDAQRLLARMPEELGFAPEPRLYAQLAHASIRERQGRRAVDVYRMMAGMAQPDASVSSSILGTCLSFNMADTAGELLAVADELGAEVLESDRAAVLQTLERRGRGPKAPLPGGGPPGLPGLPSLPGLLTAPPTAAVPLLSQRGPKYRSCYCG